MAAVKSVLAHNKKIKFARYAGWDANTVAASHFSAYVCAPYLEVIFSEKYLNKVCSFSFIVILCSQLLGCASPNSKDVADDILSGIDSLALKASKCINSKSQKSLDCIEFAGAYKNGGFDNIEAFKDNLSEIYKKDLDAGLNATEKLNIIISAVVFLSRT